MKLTYKQEALLTKIERVCREGGEIPVNRELAKDTGYKFDDLSQPIKWLENHGFIKVEVEIRDGLSRYRRITHLPSGTSSAFSFYWRCRQTFAPSPFCTKGFPEVKPRVVKALAALDFSGENVDVPPGKPFRMARPAQEVLTEGWQL